jgi:hypothetical protein
MPFIPLPSTIGRDFNDSRIHLRGVERESKVYKKKVDSKRLKRAGSVNGHGAGEVARGIPQKDRVFDPERFHRCTEV